jgi:hypothetical protein
VDLDAYLAPTGEVLDGILGLPWLQALHGGALRFDFARLLLVFGDKDVRAAETGSVSVTVPLAFEGTLPVLQLALGDRPPEWFVLDTGFPGALLLYARRAAELRAGAPALTSVEVRELAGPVSASFALLKSLRFGDLAVPDVPTVLEQAATSGRAAAFDRLAGAVGCALFEAGSLRLDPGRQRAEITWPTAALRLPGGFGFGLRATADGAQVASVQGGSPAARAGLRPGDTLLAVDGRPAAGLTPSAVWSLLRPAQTVRLELAGEGGRRADALLARERFFPLLA